jgi:hypothetical protein
LGVAGWDRFGLSLSPLRILPEIRGKKERSGDKDANASCEQNTGFPSHISVRIASLTYKTEASFPVWYPGAPDIVFTESLKSQSEFRKDTHLGM